MLAVSEIKGNVFAVIYTGFDAYLFYACKRFSSF